MTDIASDRWTRISQLYGEAIHRSSEARFSTFRLAVAVAQTLVQQLGCREEIVSHYAYSIGDAPKWDTFKKVDSPFDSVVPSDDEWVFGIGVTIEISENHWPKNTLVIPVSAAIQDDQITVTTPIIQASHVFKTDGDNDAALESYVADFIAGIERVVERWAKGQSKSARIGFAVLDQ